MLNLEFWPQYIFLALTILSIGLNIGDHKKPQPPLNAWYRLVAEAIVLTLLYMGGFFEGAFT